MENETPWIETMTELLRRLRCVDDGIVRQTRQELVDELRACLSRREKRATRLMFEASARPRTLKASIRPFLGLLEDMDGRLVTLASTSTRTDLWAEEMAELRSTFLEVERVNTKIFEAEEEYETKSTISTAA